ncbi:hypothetical protein HBI07_139400 [Parastagonospora nodorum]|nr:hypothetical protein HBI07_139400 [Parastagonospora nodorum]
MSQTNVREGYEITTLEVVELIEDLISYLLKSLRLLTSKDWLAVAKYTRLRNAQIPKYSAKVKTEDLSNTLTLTLSKTAQRRSSSVVSNRSTALITDKFSVALLTKPAILNNANVALVDAVHYSVQKLEENYFEVRAQHLKYDALIQHLLLPKPPLKRRKTEAADSRHAKASGGRTKKDKDLEDSDTSSDVPRLRRRDRAAARAQSAKRKQLGKEAQLKKTRDEEELAKAKKEKEEKKAQERKTYLDIDPKDDLEDEEATTAKDLAREQKKRLKALLNAKTRDSLSARTEVQNARAEGNATEHNAVNDDDKLYPTKGERTFYCANPLALRFCFFSDSPPENIGRLTKEEAIEMQINTTNAISKALAAANKLVAPQSYTIPEANTPAVHPKATKHRLVPSAARFIIVCGFRKVDKHVFRAYNTISVTAQRTIIRKGGPYIEKRAILLSSHVTFNATDKRDSVTSDRIYKIEDAVYRSIAETLSYRTRQNTALNSLAMAKQYEHKSSYEYKELISQGAAVAQRFMLKRTLKTRDLDFLPYFQSCLCLDFLSTVQNAKQQCRDILEKEGLNELEASRRIIFNRFEMQVIASYSTLATLKAAQFKTYSSCKVKRFTSNSVKDLFTNLSKDYFLVREARAITKSSPKEKFSDESVLVMQGVALMAFAEAITLTEATHVLAEMCVGIVYFNLDSELELKVLGKQDVKTTS